GPVTPSCAVVTPGCGAHPVLRHRHAGLRGPHPVLGRGDAGLRRRLILNCSHPPARKKSMPSSAPAASTGSKLNRSLRARHLQMIAIGGAIGTGLFLASGGTIAQAGPGGALVAYRLTRLLAVFVLQALAWPSTPPPVAGP